MSTIFFSWQSDRPVREGEALIEEALHMAVAEILADTSFAKGSMVLSIDRDTKNTPGQPPIADTIFKKIAESAIFVPDLTFVGQRPDGSHMSNPNVLVEYGWALKHFGNSRIVPVMNVAHGKPEGNSLQFDMRHLRWPIAYSCPDGVSDAERSKVRDALAKELNTQIRAVLISAEFRASLPKPIEPKRYNPTSPKSGSGRYRGLHEPLGMNYGRPDMHYPVTLAGGPVIWLRLMPVYDQERAWTLIDVQKLATASGIFLTPLSYVTYSSYGWLQAADGFGVYGVSGGMRDQTDTVVHAFKSGEIWSVDAEGLRVAEGHGQKLLPLSDLEGKLHALVRQYSEFLTRLGIHPPFRWIVGIEDTKGRALFLPGGRGPAPWRPAGHCLVDEIVADGIWTTGQSVDEALRPLINQVCDNCGVDPAQWQR